MGPVMAGGAAEGLESGVLVLRERPDAVEKLDWGLTASVIAHGIYTGRYIYRTFAFCCSLPNSKAARLVSIVLLEYHKSARPRLSPEIYVHGFNISSSSTAAFVELIDLS
ncbi:unnamed protein product [Calypogeia fissa]